MPPTLDPDRPVVGYATKAGVLYLFGDVENFRAAIESRRFAQAGWMVGPFAPPLRAVWDGDVEFPLPDAEPAGQAVSPRGDTHSSQ